MRDLPLEFSNCRPPSIGQDKLDVCRAGLLAFDPIRRSGKLRVLLEYLLRHSGEGNLNHPDQYRIAFECFGMDRSFDPNQSSLVRVHLSKLRKALQDYAVGPGQNDPLSITLPAGSYALHVRKPAAAEHSKRRPVLALIEFRGIGLEEEWNLLPALISEQLGDRISKSGTFDFMGPFSRHAMGTDDPDLAIVARKHGIDCFIDGHIHRKGGGIELGVRIIHAPTGRVTWTGAEELPLDRLSLDGISDELLVRLSSVIGADYGGVDAHFSRLARVKPEHSLSVYEAVLLGRMYFADFNPRALFKGVQRLREVVRDFPDEPLPMATLAMLLACAGHEPQWAELPPAVEIRSLATSAWRMAPEDPWSILARGYAACFGGGVHEIRRLAVALDSDPDAAAISKCGIGMLLCLRGIDPEHGLRLIHDSSRINPYQPCAVHVVEALIALRRGDLDHALARLNTYRIPWGWADPLIRGAIHVLKGELDYAAGEYRAVIHAFPDFERAALEEGRLLWHRDHMEFLIGIFAGVGIKAASCR